MHEKHFCKGSSLCFTWPPETYSTELQNWSEKEDDRTESCKMNPVKNQFFGPQNCRKRLVTQWHTVNIFCLEITSPVVSKEPQKIKSLLLIFFLLYFSLSFALFHILHVTSTPFAKISPVPTCPFFFIQISEERKKCWTLTNVSFRANFRQPPQRPLKLPTKIDVIRQICRRIGEKEDEI